MAHRRGAGFAAWHWNILSPLNLFRRLKAGAVEMIRFGDTHMSYRVDRMPWSQHRVALFLTGVILFWMIALIRYRRLAHQAEFHAVVENIGFR
jgi:hypothetical protein